LRNWQPVFQKSLLQIHFRSGPARIRNDFFPDPNPDPAKSFGSNCIRIHNIACDYLETMRVIIDSAAKNIQVPAHPKENNLEREEPSTVTNVAHSFKLEAA
jgi:hypothetical protein